MHSWGGGDIKDKKEERRVTARCVCHPTLQKTVKMPKKGGRSFCVLKLLGSKKCIVCWKSAKFAAFAKNGF